MTRRRIKKRQGSPQHDDTSALEQQGIAFFNSGDFGRAIVSLSKAVKLDPRNPRLLFSLGTAFQRVAEHDLAVKALNAAIAEKGGYAAAYNNLGLSLMELGRHEASAGAFQKAVALDGSLFEAYGNLGNALRTAGFLDEAEAAYRRGLVLRPKSPTLHRALIMTKIYDPKTSNDTLFELARAFETQHAPRTAAFHHDNDADPDRRIRIGYLSSDFRDHPAGHNLAPLFFNHDRSRFETFIYAELSTRDYMTDAFRERADHFHLTPHRTDAQLVEMIRADRIDILVFLAGYLDANRSLIAAWKPAPIQVSYHDVATSGLQTMDYWFTDPFCNPLGGTEQFTERLVRVPRLLAYRPIPDTPEPGPLPCLENGFVTFGSLNNPAKLNPEVLALFAETMAGVPDSRLLLKYTGTFDSPDTRRRFLSEFESRGIAPDRILFRYKREDRFGHLSNYRDVDIALDTFPFNGVTTTFEALWMGVPVVTLPGERFIARAAGSILRTIGFHEGIAGNKHDFIERVQRLASDRERLGALRAGLRGTMLASPLMDEKRYAAGMERVLAAMWKTWCRRRHPE